MRIATWNVNSLRVRLGHLLDWLGDARPDVACLQETKTEDANFPVTLAKRCIAAPVNGIRVVCLYAPNGEAPGTEKYAYKLRWYEALTRWMKQALAQTPNLAVLGDMNVAPEDRDVHDPKRWLGKIHVSEPERGALRQVMDAGLVDAFRLFPQPERLYSWWDYRLRAFERNWGLRIDLALLAPELARRCIGCTIDLAPRKRERPSDHAPVIVELG